MENQESAPGPAPTSSGMDPKILGIISYLTPVGFIIAFILYSSNKTDYVSFHLKQMLGIVLCGIVLQMGTFILLFIPIIGWLAIALAWLFIGVLWVIGLIGALNNEEKLVPVLGEHFQKWFKGV
jgi:uncharacterized membrane protein